MKDTRARLTIPDLVYVLMGLAYLGALYPVLSTGLETTPEVSPEAGYLFQLILPVAAIVLLVVIWTKTIGQ